MLWVWAVVEEVGEEGYLLRDAVGLGSREGGRRRGVDRQARLGEWYRPDQALVNSDPMEDSGLRHGP